MTAVTPEMGKADKATLSGDHSHGATIPDQSRAERRKSFDLGAFGVPSGREEEWRFTPVDRLSPLFAEKQTDPEAVTVTVTGEGFESGTLADNHGNTAEFHQFERVLTGEGDDSIAYRQGDIGGHAFAMAREHLEDAEDDVLLARARHALMDLQLLGDLQQLRRRHPLEVGQRVLREAFRDVRRRRTRDELLLPVLVRRLRPTADPDDTERREYAELLGRMSEAAREAIEEQLEVEEIDPVVAEGFEARLRERARRAEVLGELRSAELAAQFRRVREAQLAAEAQALAVERWRGAYCSETIARAQRALDDQEIQLAGVAGED